jgi:prepilin peptidase CpaA
MTPTLPVFVLSALMMMAAATDMSSYRIPNWLTALTAVLFFPVALYMGLSAHDFGMHVLAGVILFAVGFLFFSLGFIGGGDAKLIAATGLWFGTAGSGLYLHSAVLAGGALAITMLAWSIFKYAVQLDFNDFLPSIKKFVPKLPYGIALAAGAIVTMPQTTWMMNAQ